MALYDDRELTQAAVYGISFSEGDPAGAWALVELGVSATDGTDFGPKATFEVFVPADKDAPLSSIAKDAVDRALALVARLALEDRDTIDGVLYRKLDLDLRKK